MASDSTQSPDPTSVPASRGQASALNLVLVALALVAGACITFLLLAAHPVAHAAAEARPGAAGPSAGPVPATVPPARPVAHWSRENEYRWIANHRHSVAYELDANEQVRVWTTHVRPALVVRCLGRKTEVFVYTETPAKLESGDGTHTVRLTFDAGAETDERWPDSAEHDALFSPDGVALARRIAAAHQLHFGFTPHNADPVQVSFDLGDAASTIAQVGKTCGWH